MSEVLFPSLDDLMPLPVAATFITSRRYCQSTKDPLASLDGIPIILDEIVAHKEDVGNADEDPVLTANGGTNSVR